MTFRSRRIPTDYSVSIDLGGTVRRAQVLDLSREGLRLATEPGPSGGEEAAILVRGQRFAGRVVWASGGEFALALSRPLPSEIKGLLTRSRIAQGPGP